MEISDSTPQKGSKRVLFFTLFVTLAVTIATLVLSAAALGVCARPAPTLDGSTLNVNLIYPALGLPSFESLSWRDVLTQAQGTTVRFWMADWDIFNDWVDKVLAPRVELRYGIYIVRVPLNDTVQAVHQMEQERAAGNNKNGNVDLVWINGENFHMARAAGNLYGPWTQACPNAANFDWADTSVSLDDGTPTNGLEMPYNAVQNTYAYNPDFVWDNCTFDNVTNTRCLPRTITELLQWATINSGKFSYPAPPDFDGTTFLKNVFVTLTDPTVVQGEFDQTKYEARAKLAFPLLRAMQPHIALDNTTGKQPFSVDEVYGMFGKGQIWLVMADNALDPGNNVDSGLWPANTKSFVPTTGTLRSSDFVAIGYNSPNKLAAVVVGNEIADISMQFSRRQPDGLAQLQAYDPNSEALISGGWSVAFGAIKDAPQTPQRSVLLSRAWPALEQGYTAPLEADWLKCVVSGSTVSPCM